MQEGAQRAKLGAHGRCKVKEEEAIWTGLGTPQRFHWGEGSLGEWQQLRLNKSAGPKQDSSYTLMKKLPLSQSSVSIIDCWKYLDA